LFGCGVIFIFDQNTKVHDRTTNFFSNSVCQTWRQPKSCANTMASNFPQ